MANSFNLTAQINLQGPKNVKQVASQIKKQLGNVSVDVKLSVAKNAGKSIGQLNKNLIALRKNAIAAQTSLAQLGATAKTATGHYRKLSDASSKLASVTAKSNTSFKQTKQDVGKATTAIEDFGKQSALAVKRFAAFSVVTSIVNQFTGAIANATGEFVEFDRQMTRISQVTGDTKKQLKDLSGEITRLATSFGVSSSSLAEVSVTLSQAGLSATETKIALQALAKADLAPTFDNLKNTTEGAIASLRQFGLAAHDLEGALGSINAVAGRFAVESSDIITAIQRVGGVFASSSRGISQGQDALNEFIALFTSVRATTRESAETIATGLRTIFTRIQRGSTINFLKELGVELQDLEGNFIGPYKAIQRLSEGLAGIDPRSTTFSKIIEELGGFRQVGKVIPLLQEFATAQEALGVAQRGSGSLTDAATKAQGALAVQLTKVREQFLGLIRDIGESKTFQFLTGTALSFASALIKVVGAFKPIIPLLVALTASKGFEFLSQFGKGFSGALKGVGGAAGAVSGIGANMGDAIGGGSKEAGKQNMSANTAALVALTTEVKSLTAKMSGSPSVGMASGGSVPGSGSGDTVPAMLTPGEFVIRKSAVEAFGAGNLSKINKYKQGGAVHGVDLINAIDGDSLSVNFSPAEKPYKTSTRLKGGDTYETDSPPKSKSKFLADAATKVTDKWAKSQGDNLKDSFSKANQYDGFGRPMFDAPDLLNLLRKGVDYRGQNASLLTGRFEKKAKGGGISGSDTVPAMLTPGEFVVNKTSAQSFGYGNLKKINGYNKGGPVGGVQHFENGGNVATAPVAGGGLVGEAEAAEALDALAEAAEENAKKQKKIGSQLAQTFDKTKKKILAFGESVDEKFSAFGGVTTAAGMGLTLFAGKLSEMGTAFEGLSGTAAETSTAFQAATKGLAGAGSGLQSGSLAGQMIGGKKGRKIGAVGGAAIGGAKGILDGIVAAEKARAQKALLSAEQDLKFAEENFSAAQGIKERLQTFDELKTALVSVGTAQEDAAAAANSFASKGASAASTFLTIISSLATLAMFTKGGRRAGRSRSKSKGGSVVYASEGQLIDFQEKGTDTVPTMLTPGEFVVNARSTKDNLNVLKAINKNKGGITPQYLAGGGRAGGEGIAGDFVDVIQMESESQALNISAEIAASMATGAIPYVGAAKDFASAAANIYEGKWLDAIVDVGFGLFDAATDTLQAAGDLSVAGAAPATALGMAEQVATDQAQKAAKKSLKTLIPRMSKAVTDAFGSVKKSITGFLFGAGTKATKAAGKEGTEKATKDVVKNTTLLSKSYAFAKKNVVGLGAGLVAATASVWNWVTGNKEAQIAQAEASKQAALKVTELAKAIGNRLPDIQAAGSAEQREGLKDFDLAKVRTLLEGDRATANKQFAKLDDASTSLLRAASIQYARERGDTRSEEDIGKSFEQDMMRGFLADRGFTGAEAEKKMKGGFEDDPQMKKAFDNYVASQNRTAASLAMTAINADVLAQATKTLGYIALKTSSNIKKLTNDMNQVVAESDSRLSSIAGRADATTSMRDIDSERLSNRQGFTSEEFKSSLNSVVNAGGGGSELETAAGLLELKRAQEEVTAKLPKEASGQFRAEQFEKAFKDIGKDLGPEFQKIKDTLVTQAATSDDPEAMKAFNDKVAVAQKLFTEIAQIKFDALKKLNVQANKLSAALQRVTQLQLQGAANFANDTNRISEAGGNRLSVAERRAPADAQLEVFKKRTNAGGTSVDAFESRMNTLTAERKEVEQRQIDATAMPTDTADQRESRAKELEETGKAMGRLNAQSDTTRQALEFLANDTTALDAAMNSLAERTRQLEAQQNSYMSALTDPEQLGKSLANFAAVAAGQGDRKQVGQALQFVESQRASLGEEEYQRRRKEVLDGGQQSGAISAAEAANLSKSQNREEDGEYQTRKQLAMDEANIRQQANEALQRMEQQGVKSVEESMAKLARIINEELISAIRTAVLTANETIEQEKVSRDPGRTYDIKTQKPIMAPVPLDNPLMNPNATTEQLGRELLGVDMSVNPNPPVGAPTGGGGAGAGGAGGGGAASSSVTIDSSSLPDSLSLDTNVNVVASIPNYEALQSQIVSASVSQVSQLINKATNGGIQLKVESAVDDQMGAFLDGGPIA